jgi:hypothetical protein
MRARNDSELTTEEWRRVLWGTLADAGWGEGREPRFQQIGRKVDDSINPQPAHV